MSQSDIIKILAEIIRLNKDNLNLYTQHIREIDRYLDGEQSENSWEEQKGTKDFNVELIISHKSNWPGTIKDIKDKINTISEIQEIENIHVYIADPSSDYYCSKIRLEIKLRGKMDDDFSEKELIKKLIEHNKPYGWGKPVEIIVDIGNGRTTIFNDEIQKYKDELVDSL